MNPTPSTPDHLTAEQFGELIHNGTLPPASLEAQAHLTACEECQAELHSTREALSLFRQSTSAYAARELARTPRLETRQFSPIHRVFSPTLAWAAAGLLVVAAGLPLGLRHKQPIATASRHVATSSAPAPVSDEALLDDINREVSASVPASMQALEDPTGSASASISDPQTSATRKN